ncbi:MAG: isocitrate/isopropylmalate family dehydrogenase [Oscillospiraceae bacterium]
MQALKLCSLISSQSSEETLSNAVKVLKSLLEGTGAYSIQEETAHVGALAYEQDGLVLPGRAVERARAADMVLLSFLCNDSYTDLTESMRPSQALPNLVARLGLFARITHFRQMKPLRYQNALRESISEKGMDIVLVKEITGGIVDAESTREESGDAQMTDTYVYTMTQIRRTVTLAFEIAKKRGGRLVSADYIAVMQTSKLWKEAVNDVAFNFPEVEVQHLSGKQICDQIIRAPHEIDVIVAPNLFGELLSYQLSSILGNKHLIPCVYTGNGCPRILTYEFGSDFSRSDDRVLNPLGLLYALAFALETFHGAGAQAQALYKAADAALVSGRTTDLFCKGLPTVSPGVFCDYIAEKAAAFARG